MKKIAVFTGILLLALMQTMQANHKCTYFAHKTKGNKNPIHEPGIIFVGKKSATSEQGRLIIHDVDIETKYAAQIKEKLNTRAKLFADKDMFETTAEFIARKEKAKKFRQKVIDEFYMVEADSIALKIKQSYKKINFPIQLKGYNADTRYATITINGRTRNIKMPRAEAIPFFSNEDKIKVVAEKQLNTDLETYKTFNITIIHPISGKKYLFSNDSIKPMFLEYKGNVVVEGIPDLVVESIGFFDETGNLSNLLQANKSGKLKIKIENVGTGPSGKITAKLHVNDNTGILFPSQKTFTGLDKSKEYTFVFPIDAQKNVNTGNKHFSIKFTEELGFPPGEETYSISTEAFKAPRLIVPQVSIIEEYAKEKNGLIEKGEQIKVNFHVKNIGEGMAKQCRYSLNFNNKNLIPIRSAVHKYIGDLQPNESQEFSFVFAINNNYDGSRELPVKVTLTANNSAEYGGTIPLNLKMNQGSPEPPKEYLAEIDKDIPKTSMENPNAVALIIANHNYEKTFNVDYAINDARSMKKYLVNALGFQEENILFFTNIDKATFESIFGNNVNYKGELNKKIVKGVTELFVYYVGHGIPGGEGDTKEAYLLPVNSNISTAELSAFPRSVIYDNISKMKPKSAVIMLDACFSGQSFETETSAGPVFRIAEDEIDLDNYLILSATGEDEEASWYNDKMHSMFTYFFLKAIYEKHKTDKDNNGLTFQEIYDYISHPTKGVPQYSKQYGAKQHHPQMKGTMKNQVLLK